MSSFVTRQLASDKSEPSWGTQTQNDVYWQSCWWRLYLKASCISVFFFSVPGGLIIYSACNGNHYYYPAVANKRLCAQDRRDKRSLWQHAVPAWKTWRCQLGHSSLVWGHLMFLCFFNIVVHISTWHHLVKVPKWESRHEFENRKL